MIALSFALIAAGAIFSLLRRTLVYGRGRLNVFDFLATSMVVLASALGALGLFIGPVGDASQYHQSINSCVGTLPPCGFKLHENIWGLLSGFLGPGWGLVYGYALSSSLAFLARSRGVSGRRPLLLVMFVYCAYQLGNGMAEGTYFFLSLAALAAFNSYRVLLGALFLCATVLAHLGNLPFLVYLARFPKRSALVSVFGMLAVLVVGSIGVTVSDLLSVINKAGALISGEAVRSAVESKVNVSAREADTSYATILLKYGFPLSATSLLGALALYVAPILVVTKVGLGALVSALSTAMSVAIIWLVKRDKILSLMVLLSFVLFGFTSFTPGISLRHKVPLFLFAFVVRFCFRKKRPIHMNVQ